MTNDFGFMIESLVAILLLFTIAYCVTLNNRLKRLKADEQSLKATIAELITATEIAERAVAGLKTTAHDCDASLGAQLRSADQCCSELTQQVKAGEVLIKRLSRILAAGRSEAEGEAEAAVDPRTIGAPDPKAVAAAAQAFAERARTRLGALAA